MQQAVPVAVSATIQSTMAPKASQATQYRFRPVDQSLDRTHMEYELSVRQQPKQARMCGSGEKADRRPIDPPPIVRLRIRDRSKPPGENEPPNLIQSPFYFMFAALVPPDSDEELFNVSNTKSRYLTGTVVSSLYHLRDPSDNTYSAFFVFPDVGVRVEGIYRFRLTMYETAGNEVHQCASIFTNPFHVYSAKRFPGMEGSTELSKSFAEQGIRIRIRRPIRLRRRMPVEAHHGGYDDEEDSLDHPSKRIKGISSVKYDAMAAQYGTHPMYATGYPPQAQPGYGYAMPGPQAPRGNFSMAHVPVPSWSTQQAAGTAVYGSPNQQAAAAASYHNQLQGRPISVGQAGQQQQQPTTQYAYPYPYAPSQSTAANPNTASNPRQTFAYSQPGRPYPYHSQQAGTPQAYPPVQNLAGYPQNAYATPGYQMQPGVHSQANAYYMPQAYTNHQLYGSSSSPAANQHRPASPLPPPMGTTGPHPSQLAPMKPNDPSHTGLPQMSSEVPDSNSEAGADGEIPRSGSLASLLN